MDDAEWEAELAAEAARDEADRLRKEEPPPALTDAEFLAWRSPRMGSDNPTSTDHPLWHWLVRTRWSAAAANAMFGGPSPITSGPMWCFDRFGMSETALADGRVVHVGGEHEDYYDPDFRIYNDVIVTHPGGQVDIYAYPWDVFPPTDFHSATLVGDSILLIGNLGYSVHRAMGVTPVFRLALDTMAISPLATTGEAPGWIHGHTAAWDPSGRALVVRGGDVWQEDRMTLDENIDAWSLDTGTLHWTRLTALERQQWTMVRVDRARNHLDAIRQEHWRRDHPGLGLQSSWTYAFAPDFAALEDLYRIDASASSPVAGDRYRSFHVLIDGVQVRFIEEGFVVKAIVEGRLSEARLQALQRQTLATLERLEGASWEVWNSTSSRTAIEG